MSVLCVFSVVLSCLSSLEVTSEDLETHPRPDWARPFVLLNGPWRFDFDPENAGIDNKWFESHRFSRTIKVPFPWQSTLSGIGDTDYQGAAWYERDITIPSGLAKRRIFLVFGAIDWQATVWVNGKVAIEHEGGYTPFEVELTDLVKPGETARVTVRAYDVTDKETPNGKQTGWYTRTGGIWQSVYLSFRGRSYTTQAHITPDIDAEQAAIDCTVEAASSGRYTVEVEAVEGARRFNTQKSISCKKGLNKVQLLLPVEDPALWTPDSPTLYETRILLKRGSHTEDIVLTHFGMRKVSRGTYGDSEHEYILLNNKPIYLRGALHQSFHPDGIYTYPNDAALREDYVKAKEFGLNFIRIHIKVDNPRALYWADKLGILLMCDMPNFQCNSPASHQNWENVLRETIARDFNHPSIFSWCDFNETWGIMDGGYTREVQEWVRDMYLLTKELDPTRLVEDNSPCRYDHVVTDINSWHFYIDDFRGAAKHIANVVEQTFPGSQFNYIEGWKQDTAPLINSEYGGVSAGGGDRDIGWCFMYLTNLLRKYGKIGGYIYTELSDLEWAHNGFLNYDRSPKEFPYPAGIKLADLQGDEFAVLDCPPYQKLNAGEQVSIPVLLSHWSERNGLRVRFSVDGKTVDGVPWSKWVKSVEQAVDAKPYDVTPLEPFQFELPNARGIINVVAEVLHNGQRCAANYCMIDVQGGAAWAEPNVFAASWPVKAYSANTLDPPSARSDKHPDKVFGYGAGFIEYQIRLPYRLKRDNIAGAHLIAEVGAKADKERLDWPARAKPIDYPQTDGNKWPTDLAISINGIPLEPVRIEDDFADVAGVLSHAAKFHHGSRGRLLDMPLPEEVLATFTNSPLGKRVVTIRFEVPPDAKNAGGLSLYGATMGAYPADPALVFDLKPDVKKPKNPAEPVNIVKRVVIPAEKKKNAEKR